MPSFTDLTGLFGIAWGIAALCLLCGQSALSPWSPARRLSLLGLVCTLLLAPMNGVPIAVYVRGMVGDLSITTLLALAYAVGRSLGYFPPLDTQRRKVSLQLLAVIACVFYPLALGMTLYDPYRWGYGEPWFLLLLFCLALICVLRWPLVALSINLAVLAWVVGWYESSNLWDYLLDPMLSIYALFALVRWSKASAR